MRVGPWLLMVAALMAVAKAYTAPRPMSAARLVQSGDQTLGNPHGHLTIVDFYDTACGPCRLLNHRLDRLIRHDPNIRYVPIDVPILGHPSIIAAKALVAAERQNRLQPMLNLLMNQNRPPTNALMRSDAASLGLDQPLFAHDLTSPRTARAVAGDLSRGQALKIDYVPVVYIGRIRIPGAMSYRNLRWLVSNATRLVITERTDQSAGS